MHPVCAVSACGTPTANGDRICRSHSDQLRSALKRLAHPPDNLLAELETTATRQARLGGPVGVSTRPGGEKPVFFHESASVMLSEVRRVLLRWGKCAADTFTHFEPVARDATATAAWLASIPGLLARDLDGVERMHGDIVPWVKRIMRVIDRPGVYAYLGNCAVETEQGECPQYLYAPKDDTGRAPAWHRCPRCGTDHHVESRQRDMLDRCDDVKGTAAELSRFVAKFGVVLPMERIRQWKTRRLIKPVEAGPPPVYRLSDVEARLWPSHQVGEAS